MSNTKYLITGTFVAFILLGMSPSAGAEETAGSWEKVVFHVDETANARWALLLANAYHDDRPQAKIVIVAYGPGIDFLLEDAEDRRGNAYDSAIFSLVDKGVEFRVCAGTLSARDIDTENVLESVAIVPSGIAEIVRMQIKEGYAYLKP